MTRVLQFPTGARVTSTPRTRPALRRAAADLRSGMTQDLATLRTSVTEPLVAPTMHQDIQKGRAHSETTLFASTIDVANKAPATEVFGFAQRFYRRLMAARLPETKLSIAQAWQDETEAQAAADVAQQRMLHAIATRNRPEVDRIIDATTRELFVKQQLLESLLDARAAMDPAPLKVLA